MLKKILFILLLVDSLLTVSAQNILDQPLFVWNFYTDEGNSNHLTKALSSSVEEGLIEIGCTVLQRKNYADLEEMGQMEAAVGKLDNSEISDLIIKKATIPAEIVVFGKKIATDFNGNIMLSISFEELQTKRILALRTIQINNNIAWSYENRNKFIRNELSKILLEINSLASSQNMNEDDESIVDPYLRINEINSEVVVKKILNGTDIKKIENIDFNRNGTSEEIVAIGLDKIYILQPIFDVYSIVYRETVYFGPDDQIEIYPISCGRGGEKALVEIITDMGTSGVFYTKYKYISLEDEGFKIYEFGIEFEGDMSKIVKEYLNISKELIGNPELMLCIKEELENRDLIRLEKNDYSNLTMREKWYDYNKNGLNTGGQIIPVFFNPDSLNFDALYAEDSFMLISLEWEAGRQIMTNPPIAQNFTIECDNGDVKKNQFYSIRHCFKQGLIGYSQDAKTFFILYCTGLNSEFELKNHILYIDRGSLIINLETMKIIKSEY